MKNRIIVAGALLGMLAGAASAADRIKVGFLSTLSGPSAALGIDIRDGFNLAVKQLGGRLGGLPAEVIVGDDTLNPDTARQLTERMLKRDGVHVMTGIVFSNVMLAVAPAIFQNQTFYVSSNAGPSDLAGEKCSPFYFNVAWQNDNLHEAMGKHVQDKGFRNVYVVAPNYPAGKDAIAGFRRFYTGPLAGETYTKLGQLDYAAELAQLRAAKPDAVFIFLPGGMGINFIKQYAQAGLGTVPLFGPGFSADEDIIRAVGDPMQGMFNSSQWGRDLDNPQNKRFVAEFEADFKRVPTLYASQGYDAAMLIDSAVRSVQGKVEDRDAFRAALRKADFRSVRGAFRFNTNHHPVQDYYLRQITKDDKGRLSNRVVGTIFKDHTDAFAPKCRM